MSYNVNSGKTLQNHCINTICSGFGSLMNIDKLIHCILCVSLPLSFGSLMNIDKLIRQRFFSDVDVRFGSLMNIDKLILMSL